MPEPNVDHGFEYATKPCINCDKEIEMQIYLHWEQDDVYLCSNCLDDLHQKMFTVSGSRQEPSEMYRKQPITDELRWRIWERDDFTCQYCSARKNLSVDHIKPERYGGTADDNNLVTSCRHCNSRKGKRTPEEAGMVLKSDPRTEG